MLAFRKPCTISLGFQSFCGPAGMATMKSESGVVSRGLAPTVPGEPLFGMPTQPATDVATAASTKASRHRASHDRASHDRVSHDRVSEDRARENRAGRERRSAMGGHLGDIARD